LNEELTEWLFDGLSSHGMKIFTTEFATTKTNTRRCSKTQIILVFIRKS